MITDGDIRRMLENHQDLSGLTAADIIGAHPKTIDKSELAVNALHMMRQNNISQLIVLQAGKYDGIIHIQDLLKEGII
ncbi:Arabinose 5-phosphate isomerase KdsD [compost metagenome]